MQRDASSSSQSNGQPPEPPEEEQSLAVRAAKLAAETFASPLFYIVAGFGLIRLVSLTGEQGYSIFLFAALPVTLLTILSKTSLGGQVQQQLEQRRPGLEQDAEAMRRAHTEARQRNSGFGPSRSRWPGPLGSAPHLTGQVAGDAGFDPLKLAVDPQTFAHHYEAELLHARWAMLAAMGCLIPETLALNGVQLGEPVWWKVGGAKLSGDLVLNYAGIEGFRIAGKQGLPIIALCQLVLMGGPEYARWVGIRSLEPVGVFLPGEQTYPGGPPFDPLNFARDADGFVDQTVKEIKHGRLAMLAWLGYAVQALVTGDGPVQNLVDFLADPQRNNVLKYLPHA